MKNYEKERINSGHIRKWFCLSYSVMSVLISYIQFNLRKVPVLECNKLMEDIFKHYALYVFLDLLANTYGRGVGRIPDKRPCPAGLRDDGVSCWSDAHIYGKGCCWGCCNQCRSGYHDDGCTCRKTDVGIKVTLFERQYCRDDEDKYGALCYPKCREGWVAAGCCVCKRIMSV